MVRAAGTSVLVGERLGEGGQGIVHAAQIGGASCAVKWYRAVRNHGTVIGMVEAHPTKPGEVVLRNVGPDDWVMTPEGESAVTVPSCRRLGVRTMVVDFGSVMGRISVD
jgi:sarcosine oxidase gamma subunit